MNKTEFIRVKLSGVKPEFKHMVGLKESGKTSELLDFMTMLHPNAPKQAQGSKGEVFGNNHYLFTIYTTGILRTEKETKKRIFYKL